MRSTVKIELHRFVTATSDSDARAENRSIINPSQQLNLEFTALNGNGNLQSQTL